MNQQQQIPQMATPISSLPMKTQPPNQAEIEDPLIQNVLKEFEDQMSKPPDQQPVYEQPVYQYQQPPSPIYQQPQQPQQSYYKYNKHTKEIDSELLKKIFINTVIVFLLQNYNIVNILTAKFPDTVTKYISGKEFLVNFTLIFGIFFALMYFGIM